MCCHFDEQRGVEGLERREILYNLHSWLIALISFLLALCTSPAWLVRNDMVFCATAGPFSRDPAGTGKCVVISMSGGALRVWSEEKSYTTCISRLSFVQVFSSRYVLALPGSFEMTWFFVQPQGPFQETLRGQENVLSFR
jgi:hypothetical protein